MPLFNDKEKDFLKVLTNYNLFSFVHKSAIVVCQGHRENIKV